MTKIEEIKDELYTDKYNFLKNNKHLYNNIILLGLGGSHAYGLSTPKSDIDLRGCALNTKEEILTNGIFSNKDFFEQYTDEETDTVIYSFNKLIHLLSKSNPNVLELLGLKKEHYLYINSIGQQLLNNNHLFLSKNVIYTFGAYASSQLRRLDNKAARLVDQEQREKHILNSVMNAYFTFHEKYFQFDQDNIKLYIDKSQQKEYDSEIFMDINLKHYPLRDYKSMWSEMNNIVRDYSKIGKRNEKAITHNKLGKHMMHLIRLYMMCLDILEKEQIVTYREAEHDLLMDIRNGKYLDSNDQPIPEFYEMVDDYEKKLNYAKLNTNLPDNPDYKKINEFVMSVNEKVVKGEF